MNKIGFAALVIGFMALICVCLVAVDLATLQEEVDRKSRAAGPEAPAQAGASGEEEELSTYMTHFQRHTHKMGLAVQARNCELAGFYLDEVSEYVEEVIARFPDHDGFKISGLAQTLLLPMVTQAHRDMKGESWSAIDRAYQGIIESCNQCHEATEHAFIRIVPPQRPHGYNQSFEVSGNE